MRNKMSVQMPSFLSAKFGAFDVVSFEGREALSQPYELDIQFNSAEARLDLADLLGKPLTFGLHETVEATLLGGDLPEAARRVWHGVVRRASSLKNNENNHLYRITLAPKISLLADFTTSRLFQNQSVPEIVGALLRKHGYTGSDFVFKLTREYQVFEYVTQFCESDLAFIQRLLAQEGIYFAFEQGKNSEHLIFADNLEGYVRENLKFVAFRANSGLESGVKESVHALDIAHLTMLKKTQLKNYNYRDSNAPLLVEYGFNGDTKATNGVNFQWGDSDFRTQQQGQLLAKIRQERSIAAQCLANGRGDVMLTRPGEVLRLNGFAATEAPHGWLIVNAHHTASREDSYVNDFEAMPANRVWRPALLPSPKITGTLPAKVSAAAAEESFYATIDELGRYRVKLPFDLDTWNPGGDSRPVRLAKAYAGSDYGIHFPIHSSVEVALGFTNGDPNRPYIAHVLHDSNHADHVNNQWNTRNVIRTWGKNKLRMEDFKGKEHIKLATEFHKTQLNLGHLVDAKREQRGEGFELRTDGWGVVRSAKGLFLSADAQSGAIGQTRDMAAAKGQIDAANGLTKNLSKSAASVGAEAADLQAQIDLLKATLDDLKQAALLASAPAGMALTTAASAHIGAGDNLSLVAGGTQNWTALKNLVGLAGGAVSFFAQKLGIKLIANQGKVDIQAQNDALTLAAMKDVTVTSSADTITVAAKNGVLLAAGGGYLKIHPSGEVEIGSPLKFKPRPNPIGQPPASMTLSHPEYPKTIVKPPMKISLLQSPLAQGHGLAGMPYTLKADGAEIQKGVLDENDFLNVEHDINTKAYELELGNGRVIKIPVADEYSNPKKGKLANLGFNKVLKGEQSAQGDAREIFHLSLMENKKNNQNKEKS